MEVAVGRGVSAGGMEVAVRRGVLVGGMEVVVRAGVFVGVSVGATNCPGSQLDTARLMTNMLATHKIDFEACLIAFISQLSLKRPSLRSQHGRQ